MDFETLSFSMNNMEFTYVILKREKNIVFVNERRKNKSYFNRSMDFNKRMHK